MIPSMMNLIQFPKEQQHEYCVTTTYPHENSHISQNYVCLQHEAQQQYNNLRSYRKLETLSQLQSSLSRKLPREIRDLLYEHALGNEPSTTGGLGTWLLTSKSTCAEVTATFTRTLHVARVAKVVEAPARIFP
jgi:cell wall assembly regulator SMI1